MRDPGRSRLEPDVPAAMAVTVTVCTVTVCGWSRIHMESGTESVRPGAGARVAHESRNYGIGELDHVVATRDRRHLNSECSVGQSDTRKEHARSRRDVPLMLRARDYHGQVVSRSEMAVRGCAEQAPATGAHSAIASRPVCRQGDYLTWPGARWADVQPECPDVAAKRINVPFDRVGVVQRSLGRTSSHADRQSHAQHASAAASHGGFARSPQALSGHARSMCLARRFCLAGALGELARAGGETCQRQFNDI
jgi:hypothetical protein